ncbi:3-isopropylmalate dehydratase small subunit [Nocardia sp. NPDC001965]
MEKFRTLTAIAAPLPRANVDTDQIVPARFLGARRGDEFSRSCLHDLRFSSKGEPNPDFVLNEPAYSEAQILLTGPNFGCGSSREEAVYALWDFGIRAVIAPSFGDIFYGNALKNGLLPITLPGSDVDALSNHLLGAPGAHLTLNLETRTIDDRNGTVHVFSIAEFARKRLLDGLDELDHTLSLLPQVELLEQAIEARWPWNASVSTPSSLPGDLQ